MSLLDNASLLLTPNAYKEGKLYSVIPSNGNGDFTATRATTATRVNSSGLVDLVPYNLVQYSEQFENAAWTKSNAGTGVLPLVVANQGTAPDGTLTADRIQLNRGSGGTVSDSSVVRQQITVANNATTTISIYLKSFDGNNYQIVFSNSGVVVSQKITVTNQWQRFLLTGVSAGAVANIEIQLREGVFSITGQSVTADLLVWGAQVVEGTSARDYLRTETRLNIPRVDYSLGGCPNILLEPQRTNLALQSSSFDSATWSKGNGTIIANSTTSPSGIQDADTFLADGTSASHTLEQNISVTSGTTYSWSVYAKKNTNNFVQITASSGRFGNNVWANFDLNNGVLGSVGSATTASIQDVGNGWYRCNITGTATASGSASTYIICLITSATSARYESNTLSTSVFLWGAQLEAGAYATSFIPTTTASVTRNADSITRNNIFTNGLITAAGGTWFVELRNNRNLTLSSENVGAGLELGNSATSSTNALKFRRGGGTQRVGIWKVVGGTSTALYSPSTDNSKIAIKWNGSTADIFENGVKVVSATSFTPTNMEFLRYIADQFPTYLNEMALFPTPLTDAQCLALTA